MSDSSGDECALQIDIDGGDSARGSTGGRRKREGGRKSKGEWDPGDVVWAKVSGFNYWPAKVFDAVNDALVPDWLKVPPKSTYILVRFFGTYDMQWVSSNSAVEYEKGLKKKFHNKSKRKVFVKAVKEVRSYINEGVIPEGLTLRPPDPPELDEPSEVNREQLDDVIKDPYPPTTTLSSHILTNDRSQSLTMSTSSTFTYTITADPTQPHTKAHPVITNPSSSSRRRKGSTPRRLSSSSSLHSTDDVDLTCPTETKKVKVNDLQSQGLNQGSGSKVQAFTCAPLPLSSSLGQE